MKRLVTEQVSLGCTKGGRGVGCRQKGGSGAVWGGQKEESWARNWSRQAVSSIERSVNGKTSEEKGWKVNQ